MKKLLLVAGVASLLTACGSTGSNNYQQNADNYRAYQAQQARETVKRAPTWFTKRPKNTADVVYGVGYASSTNMMMALDMAESEAYRQLCQGGGGIVESQSKVFRSDKNGEGDSLATTAIRTRCPGIDITGAEVVESDVYTVGNKFTYYVLVALPLGDANSRARAKADVQRVLDIEARSEREFQDMDRNNARSTEAQTTGSVPTDSGEIKLMSVDNAEYKKRRDEALQKPGAFVTQVTVR